jgi:hypothetical protein
MGEMKGALALLFAVGFIVNLLQLTGSVYMMQVYDRVLASQSEATLLALTLISLFLIAIYGLLEGCRSFALIGLGRLIDRRLSSRVFDALFVQGSLRGSDRVGAQPLRDLEQVRSFISTTGLTTSLDAPWIPVFLVILCLFRYGGCVHCHWQRPGPGLSFDQKTGRGFQQQCPGLCLCGGQHPQRRNCGSHGYAAGRLAALAATASEHAESAADRQSDRG